MVMKLDAICRLPVVPDEHRLMIGDQPCLLDENLPLQTPLDHIKARALADKARPYSALSQQECRPQVAILLYELTGRVEVLSHYFPLLRILSEAEQTQFGARLNGLLAQRDFRVRLKEAPAEVADLKLPEGVRVLVAGQLLEMYYYRPDLLQYVISRRRSFWIYPTAKSYQYSGGKGGGEYHPVLRAVRIGMQRLFEGYYAPLPGASPLLHELGHLLESLNGKWWYSAGSGLLPGLMEGAFFNPEAFSLFKAGKAVEAERYKNCQQGQAPDEDAQPLGSPYLFQNDHEFIAGYLEMFFRNPHAFARRNVMLYRAFERIFGWDPRDALSQDYQGYLAANQKEYARGRITTRPGLS